MVADGKNIYLDLKKLQELVEELDLRMYGLVAVMESVGVPQGGIGGGKSELRDLDTFTSILMNQACQGTVSLDVWSKDENWFVSVDGRIPFSLQPKVARLAELLCAAGSGGKSDVLVGWKSVDDLCADLGISPNYLRTLIGRLRKALAAAGENPYLVQYNAEERAYRLAVRRRPPIAAQPSHPPP